MFVGYFNLEYFFFSIGGCAWPGCNNAIKPKNTTLMKIILKESVPPIVLGTWRKIFCPVLLLHIFLNFWNTVYFQSLWYLYYIALYGQKVAGFLVGWGFTLFCNMRLKVFFCIKAAILYYEVEKLIKCPNKHNEIKGSFVVSD